MHMESLFARMFWCSMEGTVYNLLIPLLYMAIASPTRRCEHDSKIARILLHDNLNGRELSKQVFLEPISSVNFSMPPPIGIPINGDVGYFAHIFSFAHQKTWFFDRVSNLKFI